MFTSTGINPVGGEEDESHNARKGVAIFFWSAVIGIAALDGMECRGRG